MCCTNHSISSCWFLFKTGCCSQPCHSSPHQLGWLIPRVLFFSKNSFWLLPRKSLCPAAWAASFLSWSRAAFCLLSVHSVPIFPVASAGWLGCLFKSFSFLIQAFMGTNLPLSLYECISSASLCYIFILIYLGIFYSPSDFNLDLLVTEEYLHFMRCQFFFLLLLISDFV